MNTHFLSSIHDTRLVVSNWKMPYLNTLFDSITTEKDKLIHVGALIYSKGKYNSLMIQGNKNTKSK